MYIYAYMHVYVYMYICLWPYMAVCGFNSIPRRSRFLGGAGEGAQQQEGPRKLARRALGHPLGAIAHPPSSREKITYRGTSLTRKRTPPRTLP